ncbi:MAG: STAS domain-containing protein [Leptospiraceae bacterium]|nr:STAS domain-containing protein [Leptospiraceae bacterium]MDW8306140.1 STAS domain-containing protein [Leptospiraceae bacterium]
MEPIVEIQNLPNGVLVILQTAHLHMYHIPEFREIMGKEIHNRPEKVILDLANVNYLDSSALGAIFAIHKEIQSYGGKFVLINLNQTIRMVFRLTRADALLLTAESLDDAQKL